jgi:hypothetical protein
MLDDTEATALCARPEAIGKEAEDADAQAAAARRHVQTAHLLLEESKATVLEKTATGARQRVPFLSLLSSSPATASQLVPTASQLVPTASSTYEDMVIAGLHLQAAAVLNVRQLVNIVLDSSSTNYVSWRDLMEQALQRYAMIKHITDDTLSNDPGWIWMDNVSSIGSATPSRRIFTRWSGNAAVQHATSGPSSRTSFSATVSNVPFTLTLPFASLFKATSQCRRPDPRPQVQDHG